MTKIATTGRRFLKHDLWHDDNGEIPGSPRDWDPPMTDGERHEAALSDPDCQPIPYDKPARRVAKVKRIRWKLRLSQEDLAERFRIPVATQRAWERHEAEPTPVELAFLDLIEREPEVAARALLEPAE